MNTREADTTHCWSSTGNPDVNSGSPDQDSPSVMIFKFVGKLYHTAYSRSILKNATNKIHLPVTSVSHWTQFGEKIPTKKLHYFSEGIFHVNRRKATESTEASHENNSSFLLLFFFKNKFLFRLDPRHK